MMGWRARTPSSAPRMVRLLALALLAACALVLGACGGSTATKATTASSRGPTPTTTTAQSPGAASAGATGGTSPSPAAGAQAGRSAPQRASPQPGASPSHGAPDEPSSASAAAVATAANVACRNVSARVRTTGASSKQARILVNRRRIAALSRIRASGTAARRISLLVRALEHVQAIYVLIARAPHASPKSRVLLASERVATATAVAFKMRACAPEATTGALEGAGEVGQPRAGQGAFPVPSSPYAPTPRAVGPGRAAPSAPTVVP